MAKVSLAPANKQWPGTGWGALCCCLKSHCVGVRGKMVPPNLSCQDQGSHNPHCSGSPHRMARAVSSPCITTTLCFLWCKAGIQSPTFQRSQHCVDLLPSSRVESIHPAEGAGSDHWLPPAESFVLAEAINPLPKVLEEGDCLLPVHPESPTLCCALWCQLPAPQEQLPHLCSIKSCTFKASEYGLQTLFAEKN